MRILVKRIKVIQMTEEEIRKFQTLMEQARTGHTSHYAEEQLEDGSFLGVQVISREESAIAPPPPKRTSSKRYFEPVPVRDE